MAPELWPEVKSILAAALELDGQERAEYLARACVGRPTLRNEVDSLIASYEEAGDFLERPVLEPPPGVEEVLGRRIGPYRIEETIGKGGMGAVYRAVRVDSESRQQVAIKLIKPGMDTGFILRRFRHEGQILAALHHPNIAKLLDGGTTEDGLPYFVMEYIPGLPIDQYCDRHRLDTSERLKLFLDVCSAVHYAHEKKVIHRDLKPHNILITAEGVPKLLDFGIAKILDPDLATGTLDVTATVLRLMTPEYASPEQVRGEPVTAASDVYSMGVLLYELLTGHRPYRLKSRSAYEMVQVICEGEPSKPSTAVGKTELITQGETVVTVTPEVVSETREGDPAKLRRRLAGDLDNIVLMALRKEPKRRYVSAEALAEDIRRHLQGTPVRARRDAYLYSGLKLFQRHRAPLFAGLLVAIVLVAGMAWLSKTPVESPISVVTPRRSVAVLGFRNLSERADWEWLSTALSEMLVGELAAGEKLRAVSAEASAPARAAMAETADRNVSLQSLAGVRQAVGADYVVFGSYVVVNTSEGAQIRLDVRAQAAMNGEMVATVRESGPEAELLRMIGRAGSHLREQLGMSATRPDASLPANALAARYYSQGVARLRTFDTLQARDDLQRAVAEDPNYPLAHSALALALISLGHEAEATEHARKAFELSNGLAREERLFIQAGYYEIARAWDKAVDLYRQLWTAFPDTADYGLRLASTLIPSGKPAEALEVIRQIRQLPRSHTGDPRIDLAEADAASASSDFVRAQAAAARVAAHPAAAQSPILVARAKLVEARALAELGELARSAAVAEASRELYEREKHERGMALALSTSASALAQMGNLGEAKSRNERALAVYRRLGSQAGVAAALDRIGAIHRQYGELAAARQFHDQALAIRRATGDRPGIAVSLASMGSLLQEEGRLQEARRLYEESLEIRRALGQRRGAARVEILLARVLRRLGEVSAAESMSRHALTELQEVGDQSSAGLAEVMLADVLYDRGQFVQAREHYQRALDMKRKVGDRSSVATALYGLGRVALAEREYEQARRSFEESFVLRHEIGERIQEGISRLGIAELAIYEQRAGAGELLAKQAVEEYERQRLPEKQAWAHAVLAQTLIAEGKVSEAQASVRRASALRSKVEMVQVLAALEIAAAQVEAAGGRKQEAAARLDRLGAALNQKGLLAWERQARLALP